MCYELVPVSFFLCREMMATDGFLLLEMMATASGGVTGDLSPSLPPGVGQH